MNHETLIVKLLPDIEFSRRITKIYVRSLSKQLFLKIFPVQHLPYFLPPWFNVSMTLLISSNSSGVSISYKSPVNASVG